MPRMWNLEAKRCNRIAAACLVLFGTVASAQVLEVSGGASSLYQAQGASFLLRTPSSAVSMGAGFSQGRFVAGGSMQRRSGARLLTTGMQELLLDVPTDLVTGHRFRAVGIGMQDAPIALGATSKSTWQVFAGSTSSWRNTPLFQGTEPEALSAAVLLRHALGSAVELSSQTVYASRFTALESVAWNVNHTIRVAGTAGLSGGSPYAAVSSEIRRPLFDVKSSYVAAPVTFQRAGLDSDLVAEPIHGNIDVTLRSSRNPRYTAELAHHSFLNPSATGGGALTSTVDDVSAGSHLRQVGFGGSVIRSSYNGLQTDAMTVTMSYVPPWRWSLQAQYMQSTLRTGSVPAEPERTWVANVSRDVTSRLRLTGVFTHSLGKSDATMEGSLLTNHVNLSVNMQTYYNPANPAHPFQQNLVFSSELTLFGRLRLLASSYVSPNGKVNYTAEAHAVATRGIPVANTAMPTAFGQYILHGRVLEVDRAPVSGAAVEIDGEVLFTDSEGHFFVREKRKKIHRIRVIPEQFLDGYRYRIVSQPTVLESKRFSDIELKQHTEGKGPEPLFVVTRQDGETPSSSTTH